MIIHIYHSYAVVDCLLNVAYSTDREELEQTLNNLRETYFHKAFKTVRMKKKMAFTILNDHDYTEGASASDDCFQSVFVFH